MRRLRSLRFAVSDAQHGDKRQQSRRQREMHDVLPLLCQLSSAGDHDYRKTGRTAKQDGRLFIRIDLQKKKCGAMPHFLIEISLPLRNGRCRSVLRIILRSNFSPSFPRGSEVPSYRAGWGRGPPKCRLCAVRRVSVFRK